MIRALAAFAAGSLLLFLFEEWYTRLAGVLLLFVFIVLGVFALATPDLLRDDD